MASCVRTCVLSDGSILNGESSAIRKSSQAGWDVQVLFKMDKAGEGQEIVAADLAQNRDPSFIGFTHQMFLEVAGLPPPVTPPVALPIAYIVPQLTQIHAADLHDSSGQLRVEGGHLFSVKDMLTKSC